MALAVLLAWEADENDWATVAPRVNAAVAEFESAQKAAEPGRPPPGHYPKRKKARGDR